MLYLHIKQAFNCILSMLYSLIFDINLINMYMYISLKHAKKKGEPVCRLETAVKNGLAVTREPITIGHTHSPVLDKIVLNFKENITSSVLCHFYLLFLANLDSLGRCVSF